MFELSDLVSHKFKMALLGGAIFIVFLLLFFGYLFGQSRLEASMTTTIRIGTYNA